MSVTKRLELQLEFRARCAEETRRICLRRQSQDRCWQCTRTHRGLLASAGWDMVLEELQLQVRILPMD